MAKVIDITKRIERKKKEDEEKAARRRAIDHIIDEANRYWGDEEEE